MQIRHVRIFFNMAPLSTIHSQTILGLLNQVLKILVKNVGSTVVVMVLERMHYNLCTRSQI